MSLLKHPLFYFAIAAAAFVVVLFSWHRAPTTEAVQAQDRRVVRITAAHADALKQAWARQYGRAPTDAEFRRLLADRVREELLAREALAMGLHETDDVVRRALAQRMEQAVDETVAVAQPTEDDVRRTFEANRARFEQSPGRISFTQIFFSRERRGARAVPDAMAAARRLRGERVSGALDAGDPTMLPASLVAQDEAAVTAQFGGPFAQKAFALPVGTWQGPIASTVGVHVVRVTEKIVAPPRELAEVRAQVVELWRSERRAAARDAYVASLMKKYEITLDPALQPYVEAGGAIGGTQR